MIQKRQPHSIRNGSRPFIDRLVARLREKLQHFARFLNRKAEPYSAKTKRGAVLLFSVVCLSVSLWTLVQNSHTKDSAALRLTPIHVMPLPAQNFQATTMRPLPEHSVIHQWKVYFDRMVQSAKRTQASDSFLKARPHLLDTLRYLDSFISEK